ncbi:hypothetical protein BROUX41_004970 [Berkeleyomyces rouxiae]|uniref:uncharacterized protein n=1 Tax=Berkeleyomyces rouxiae TaxID=2035830 RepID=UPI003B80F4D9
MLYRSALAATLALAGSVAAHDPNHSHDSNADVWKALENQAKKRQATVADENPASKQTTTWEPPSSVASDLKDVWQQSENTYSNGDLYGFKNYGWDQLMATDGSVNLCVRWDSTKSLPAATREKIAATAQSSYEKWFSWMYGFDNFPFSNVSVSIVGWAVNDRSLLEGSTEGLNIYTDSKDVEGKPECIPSCGRMFNQQGDYSSCAGGDAAHYDQSLWLTDGMGGGAGGDWGARMGTEYFLEGMENGNVHIFEHEIGHIYGLDDFYDWKPAGQTNFIMLAGSSTVITEFDGWMFRNWWYELSRNRNWQSGSTGGGNNNTTQPSSRPSSSAAVPSAAPTAPEADPVVPTSEPSVPTEEPEQPAAPTSDSSAIPTEEPETPDAETSAQPTETYGGYPTSNPEVQEDAVPTPGAETTEPPTEYTPSEPSSAPDAVPTTMATSTRRRKSNSAATSSAPEAYPSSSTTPTTSDEQGALEYLGICSGWGSTAGASCKSSLKCTLVINDFGICL